MTDHLSECWCAGRCPSYPGEDCPCRDCICVELRACEQRIANDIYMRGFMAALDAAEAAVAEQQLVPLEKQGRFIITRNRKLWDQRQAWSELGWWDFRKSALAAIRALKEKP